MGLHLRHAYTLSYATICVIISQNCPKLWDLKFDSLKYYYDFNYIESEEKHGGFQKVFIKNQQNFLSAVQNLVQLTNYIVKKAETLKIRKFLWSICFETVLWIFLNTRISPVNNSIKKGKKKTLVYTLIFLWEKVLF